MSLESSKLVLDPRRNLTSEEILGVMDRKNFTRPEDIAEEAWVTAIDQVREALAALNLDIPFKNVKLYFETLCKDVDNAVRDCDSVDANLLQDPVVKRIRELISMRIRIRFQLSNHKFFPQLIDLLRRKNGNVSLVEIKREYGQTIVINMYELVRVFGKTDEQKRFAWDIIDEFLSEQTGVSVKLRSKFADPVPSFRAPLAVGVAPKDICTIPPEIELPEGLSLDNVDAARRQYFGGMYYLKRCLRNAIDNIEISILEISDMIDGLAKANSEVDLEKRRLLIEERQYLIGEKAKFEELLGIIDPSSVVP